MNREYLLMLADHLENSVRDDRWDFSTWGQVRGCGTVCCAMGHATDIPEFRALGLRLEFHEGLADLWFGTHQSFEASAAFFGISYGDACYLFDQEDYGSGVSTSRAEVIKRIRRFAKPESDRDRTKEHAALPDIAYAVGGSEGETD